MIERERERKRERERERERVSTRSARGGRRPRLQREGNNGYSSRPGRLTVPVCVIVYTLKVATQNTAKPVPRAASARAALHWWIGLELQQVAGF